eukprot:253577-Hanusia_phi.AAC.1
MRTSARAREAGEKVSTTTTRARSKSAACLRSKASREEEASNEMLDTPSLLSSTEKKLLRAAETSDEYITKSFLLSKPSNTHTKAALPELTAHDLCPSSSTACASSAALCVSVPYRP